MLLFRREHVKSILSGQKTQTRRLWKKPRVKVGSIQKCYSGGLPISKCPRCGGDGGMSGIIEEDFASMGCVTCKGTGRLQPFASVRILRVWQTYLEEITPEELTAEGYPEWAKDPFGAPSFASWFSRINHKPDIYTNVIVTPDGLKKGGIVFTILKAKDISMDSKDIRVHPIYAIEFALVDA